MKSFLKSKSLIVVILTLIMLFTLTGVIVIAEEPAVVATGSNDTTTWTYYDNYSLIISGTGATGQLPDSLSDYKALVTKITIEEGVTEVSDSAFYEFPAVRTIKLPSSVSSIGKSACYDCEYLKTINIPDAVTEIKSYAFDNCKALSTIKLPDHLSKIDRAAFQSSGLESIIIPDGVTVISPYVFNGCANLHSINIPEKVTSIGEWALADTKVNSIVIPNGVEEIGDHAFKATSITEISIPNSVSKLAGCLQNCTSLNKVKLPDNLETIPSEMFYGCSALEEIEIPASVKNCESSAFSGCASLKSIILPKDMTQIADYLLQGCSSLTEVSIPDKVTSIGTYSFANCSSVNSLVIPETVTEIGSYAFSGCTSLEEMTIPSSITELADFTFSYCTSLKKAILPETMTSLGGATFCGCSALEDIKIPENITYIPGLIFQDCTALEEITIPKNVTLIGMYSFKGIDSLDIYFEGSMPKFQQKAFYGSRDITLHYPCYNGTWSGVETCNWQGCSPSYALIHNEVIVKEGKDPTCTETGLTQEKYCEDCDTTLMEQEIIPALGHDTELLNAKEATCTEKGYSGDKVCKTCGETVEEGKEIDALGHDVELQNAKEATCTEQGYTGDEVCKTCGQTQKLGEAIPALGHDYEVLGISEGATCTGTEKTLYRCTRCGYEKVEETAPALGHNFKDWETMESPTCTTQGYEQRECCNCGLIETRNLDLTDHYWTPSYVTSKEPTCTEEGSECLVCQYCGAETASRVIPALGHDVALQNVKEGTCTEDGYSGDYICNRCLEIFETGNTVKATGHTYVNGYCKNCNALEPGTTGARNRVLAASEILRVFGESRYGTCLNIADKLKIALGVDKFDAVVIANSQNFPDALSGSYLACVKNAPILIVDTSNEQYSMMIKDYVMNNLNEGGTIYVLGGDGVVKTSFATMLQECVPGSKTVTLGGLDRLDTNLKILKEVGVEGQDEMLITGATGFADSLSAASTGKPMMLIVQKLNDTQLDYLASTGIKKVTILGGTSVIPESTEKQLTDLGYEVSRLSGAGRYETSTVIADAYFGTTANAVTLAWGGNFPDALCGGPLAHAIGAPIVLTDPNFDYAANYASTLTNFKVVGLGGAGGNNDHLTDSAINAVKAGEIVEDYYDR